MEETMNEFELQTQIMKAREVKPSDKFVMLVILKHVDWNTWTGRITQTYLCEYADIPRATFSRAMKRLKDAGWLTVDCDRTAFNKFQTTIKVNIDCIKMSQPLCQNDTNDCIKMSQQLSQDDTTVYQNDTTLSQNDTTLSQNDAYININNINNKDINKDINKDDLEMVSKQEALEHTSSQPFESLSYMVDERGKVPFHVLSAKHRRLEMERRWNKDDISKQDHNVFAIRRVRDTFEKKEIREDFDIYDSTKPIKRTWR
jgi:hypothetical protein